MKKWIKLSLKREAFKISLLLPVAFLIACAGSSGGGGGGGSSSACVAQQNLSTAFQMVQTQARVTSGQLSLLVKFANSEELQSLRQEFELIGDSETRFSKINSNTASIEMKASSEAEKIMDRYVQEKRIQNVEPDFETFSTAVGIDDSGLTEVELSNLKSATRAVRATAVQGTEVIVAVIDTGVDYTHKDLAPYIWKNSKEIAGNDIDDDNNGYVDDVRGWDFVNNDNDPMADDTRSYHGTHVAGIVKQAALLAEQGINVKIMPLKYLDSFAAGRTSNAIRAIDYAVSQGAKILNNSWGSFSYSTPLAEAIERARAQNVLFLAASGNGDANGNGINIDESPFYPAAYPINNIVSVAAVDANNVLASWSNFGVNNVDLAGPGVRIVSTRNGNTYAALSGTSMATPYISGVAAMLWSLRPELSYVEIRRILMSATQKSESLSGKTLTGGAVDRSMANSVAASYVHNPNDLGTPEVTPSGICSR